MKMVGIDFEFNKVTHPKVNLVCAVTEDQQTGLVIEWWLHKDKLKQQKLITYLNGFDAVLGYACVAEAISFISLGVEPLKWKWIDEFYEYRVLTNHNDDLLYGKQLVDGKVKMTFKPKPKWEREEGEKAGGFSPTHSLAEATYKLTGKIRDTEHKTKMRDLIISAPDEFKPWDRKAIIKYCREDVVDLKPMWAIMKLEFKKLLGKRYDEKQYIKEALIRGRYAVHTAHMESRGYPIDVEKTKNFSSSVPSIIYDIQREINGYFPDIKPFRWNKKENRFSENQKNIKDWIINESGHYANWMRTPTGGCSLSMDAFSKFYNFAHDYPTDNFGAQMVRYLKLKQSIYGFSSSKKSDKKTFWDSVGPDGRVRPYLNAYKAQSSRSQPGATGFMFLKPAWMRALVAPAKGKFCAGIDYGSQEFFLSALLADDKNMIEAYLSGDPYLAFGKLSKQIPKDGTKETHGFQRNACKSTVLGISYLMTKWGLAIKLTADTGKKWTEDEAQEQIDYFYEAFWRLEEAQQEWIEEYNDGIPLKLPCGWYMFCDNDNFRSVANARIQGWGASIMRRAVELATERGIKVMFTLHDALYMEDDIGNEWKIEILREAMRDAFTFYLPEKYKEIGARIKLDPFAWSPNYERDSEKVVGKSNWKIPVSDIYIDERAIEDYKKFAKYFEKPKTEIL